MAERKADRHPEISNGYHIPVDSQKLASFPHQANLTVVLTAAHADYEVYQKDIPLELAGRTHQGMPVHWLNNFGLKHKVSGEFAADVPQFSLLFEHISGADFVFYDGKNIQPLATLHDSRGANQVRASLSLGDPPIGWVGK
jgi:hypothetical protein